MTTEQKMQVIEENYINGNWRDAIIFFKKLTVDQREEYAINEMYITYNQGGCRKQQYEFAKFLIRNI